MNVPWHLVAAAMFVVRWPLSLIFLSPASRSDVGLMILVAAIHAVLAIGFVMRQRIAILVGIYAAALGLVTPFIYGSALAGVSGSGPLVAVNTVFSALLLGATIAAWRQQRAQAT